MKKINSLAFRMPLVICLIVVVIIVVMLISSIKIGSKGISTSRLGGFNSTIAGYAAVLDTWFGLQSSLINTYSSTPTISRYLQGVDTVTMDLLLNTIKNFKTYNQYIINIGVADINGNIIADSVSSALVGKNLKDYIPDAWNQFVTISSDQVFYSDKLHQSEVTKKWSMPTIKLVRGVNNQVVGYIYMYFLIGLCYIKHILLI